MGVVYEMGEQGWSSQRRATLGLSMSRRLWLPCQGSWIRRLLGLVHEKTLETPSWAGQAIKLQWGTERLEGIK
jgi:hypothetical protein